MPLFAEREVTTLAAYITALDDIRTDRSFWFRGQSRKRFKLVPSLARLPGDWLGKELALTKRFQQNASALVSVLPTTEWEWLLLMQHYGVPTRLLDWSENPLAALYFATFSSNSRVDGRSDGVVWVLDPVSLNTVSRLPLPSSDLPILDFSRELDVYRPSEVARAIASQGPVAVLARRMFPRLVAQQGVFTVAHRSKTAIERIDKGSLVGRIIVPGGAKKKISSELWDVGVNRLSLFPELESAAELARKYAT